MVYILFKKAQTPLKKRGLAGGLLESRRRGLSVTSVAGAITCWSATRSKFPDISGSANWWSSRLWKSLIMWQPPLVWSMRLSNSATHWVQDAHMLAAERLPGGWLTCTDVQSRGSRPFECFHLQPHSDIAPCRVGFSPLSLILFCSHWRLWQKQNRSASLCCCALISLAVASGFQPEGVSERTVLWCQLRAQYSPLDQFEVCTGAVEHLDVFDSSVGEHAVPLAWQVYMSFSIGLPLPWLARVPSSVSTVELLLRFFRCWEI